MFDRPFRIATWNIASNKDLRAIIAKVAALDVDVCGLQEVSLDPASDLDAGLLLRQAAGKSYTFHFAPALPPQHARGKHYGLGLLSRIPLRQTASFQLGPEPGSSINMETEPRILQAAVLDWPRPVLIWNTHLAATQDWSLSAMRRAQARAIADIVRSTVPRGLAVLGGDFNTAPSSSDLTELRVVLPFAHSPKQSTFVSEPARQPIDFFLTSTDATADVVVHRSDGLSDHDIVATAFRAERDE